MLDSIIIKAARLNHVEAGGALAVDREGYSEYVTNVIKSLPNVEIIYDEVDKYQTASHPARPAPITFISIKTSIYRLLNLQALLLYYVA